MRVEEGTCPVLTEFSKGVKYRCCESELAVFILGVSDRHTTQTRSREQGSLLGSES